MRGSLLAALLGLLVMLAAGKEDLGLQNFNLTQVAASGRPPWWLAGPAGGSLEAPGDASSRASASSRRAGPGNSPDHCPAGLGEALIPVAGTPPPRQSPSSLLSPQFSGMWYEIALASNLEHQSSSPGRKVGAVIVEQDGAHLGLTSVSDQ